MPLSEQQTALLARAHDEPKSLTPQEQEWIGAIVLEIAREVITDIPGWVSAVVDWLKSRRNPIHEGCPPDWAIDTWPWWMIEEAGSVEDGQPSTVWFGPGPIEPGPWRSNILRAYPCEEGSPLPTKWPKEPENAPDV